MTLHDHVQDLYERFWLQISWIKSILFIHFFPVICLTYFSLWFFTSVIINSCVNGFYDCPRSQTVWCVEKCWKSASCCTCSANDWKWGSLKDKFVFAHIVKGYIKHKPNPYGASSMTNSLQSLSLSNKPCVMTLFRMYIWKCVFRWITFAETN